MLVTSDQRLPCTHLSLDALPRRARFGQWQQWMEHMVDVTALAPGHTDDFQGSLQLYAVGDAVLSHCRSDGMRIHRGLDRISRDGMAHYVFHVILEGGHGRAIFEGREVITRPGDIVMLDFDQAATIERESYSALGVFVPRAMLVPYLDRSREPVLIAPRESALTAMAYDWIRAFVQLLPTLDEPAAQLAIAGFLPLLAASCSQENGPVGSGSTQASHALRDEIAKYISDNREDPDLGVQRVVDHFGLSRSQLYRLFEGAPESPSATIRRYRLKAAINDVLHRTDMSIAQIAYSAGFGTPASFSTAVRRVYRLSPRQLRVAYVARRSGQGRLAVQANRPYAGVIDPPVRHFSSSG